MSDLFTTETLDKTYLEYSNITKAKTAKELKLEQENAKLKERLKDAMSILSELNNDFDSMEHSYVGKDSDYHKRIKAVLKWGSDE